ncbi:Hypothetical protein KNT65_gp161 [Escherichia phage EcS1]|uniref:SprT-like domain-containing protein n=1 Tax=Escherichia phage EcS1 TaxID=2083276 RepID=A0A2Z5ZD02_9CAUD|nr:Hypothetical protein KNT65_gp161 [Escherichia phage EcS1]BBC78332.1 Hypothetical protein [Escherichia phage EcS1]
MNLIERIASKAFYHNGVLFHSVDSAKGFFEAKCKQHGLDGWDFKIVSSTRKHEIAHCSYRKKLIAFQAHWFFAIPAECVEEIILHELAHALTEGHGHDKVWRAKALELGDKHARAKLPIKGRFGFNESWMINAGHTRQESEFDVAAFTNQELPRSQKPSSPNFGGEVKRVAKPTKLAVGLYTLNRDNKSYFISEMMDLGYKYAYAEIQWKLCKSFSL